MAFLGGNPDPGSFPGLWSQVLSGEGIPQSQLGREVTSVLTYTFARTGPQFPHPWDRTAQRVLATWQAVCLLCSHRMTKLTQISLSKTLYLIVCTCNVGTCRVSTCNVCTCNVCTCNVSTCNVSTCTYLWTVQNVMDPQCIGSCAKTIIKNVAMTCQNNHSTSMKHCSKKNHNHQPVPKNVTQRLDRVGRVPDHRNAKCVVRE